MFNKERLETLLNDEALDNYGSVQKARKLLHQGFIDAAYKILSKDIALFYTDHRALYNVLISKQR